MNSHGYVDILSRPSENAVILRTAQPDFRAHLPRPARKSGALARSEWTSAPERGKPRPGFDFCAHDVNGTNSPLICPRPTLRSADGTLLRAGLE
jgi:hypothetical protein